MVFQYFTNMIGETELNESENTEHGSNAQNVFLTTLAKKVNKQNKENILFDPEEKADNLGRLAGFAVGIGNLYLQESLSYPLKVFRRQCQLNERSSRYHLSPFTLLPVIKRIQQRQGFNVLWKGWGSSCICNCVQIVTEVCVSEVVGLPSPKRFSTPASPIQKSDFLAELLKGVTLLITLPLYSASLKDSVQTCALEEPRSAFAFFQDAYHRVIGSHKSRGHGVLLPAYSLIVPAILYGVLRYFVKLMVVYAQMRANCGRCNVGEQLSGRNMKKIYYIELTSSVVASMVTDVLMFPLETVFVRLLLQGSRTIIDDTDNGLGVLALCTNYGGITDCARAILGDEGPAGFYKGFGALILQYFVQGSIVRIAKPIYDCTF